MVTVKILGSASGVPTENRFPTSILVKQGKNYYLLDAGEPCAALLVRENIPYNKIKALFISHMDPDHSSGIFMLLQLMMLRGRKSPFKLLVPEEALAGLKHYLDTVYLFREILHFPLELIPVKENKIVYDDGKLTLGAYKNSHLEIRLKKQYPQLNLESYSYELKLGGKRIVYSGDIGRLEDLDGLLNSPADLVISEMAHFKPEEFFLYFSTKQIKKVLFTHLHPALNSKHNQLMKSVKTYLDPNKVHIAYDGLEIEA
ncbi:MAG: ribonuclease Z [Victivallaceae bacterium]|nr:ribonuclease Z [Victivallaceae bacterium]